MESSKIHEIRMKFMVFIYLLIYSKYKNYQTQNFFSSYLLGTSLDLIFTKNYVPCWDSNLKLPLVPMHWLLRVSTKLVLHEFFTYALSIKIKKSIEPSGLCQSNSLLCGVEPHSSKPLDQTTR